MSEKDVEVAYQKGIQDAQTGRGYSPTVNIIPATFHNRYATERDAYDKGYDIGKRSRGR